MILDLNILKDDASLNSDGISFQSLGKNSVGNCLENLSVGLVVRSSLVRIELYSGVNIPLNEEGKAQYT